jgi:hypothetical protein
MDRTLIEYELEDGGTILVESDYAPPDTRWQKAAGGRPVAIAEETLAQSADKIKSVAGTLLSRLRDLPEGPSEIEVEFGIKMGGESGVIVASSTLEANFAVVLRWKREG